jgi:hypothetical protein
MRWRVDQDAHEIDATGQQQLKPHQVLWPEERI